MLACRARAKNVWNLTLPEGHYMLQIVTLLGHVVFTYKYLKQYNKKFQIVSLTKVIIFNFFSNTMLIQFIPVDN